MGQTRSSPPRPACFCTTIPHSPIMPSDFLRVLSRVLFFIPTGVNQIILQYARCPVIFFDTSHNVKDPTYVLQKEPLTQVDEFVGVPSCPAPPQLQGFDPVSSTLFVFSGKENVCSHFSIWDIRLGKYTLQDQIVPCMFPSSVTFSQLRWDSALDVLYVFDSRWNRFEGILANKWRNTSDWFRMQVAVEPTIFEFQTNAKFTIVYGFQSFKITCRNSTSWRLIIPWLTLSSLLISDFLIFWVEDHWYVIDLEVLSRVGELMCLRFDDKFRFFHYDSQHGLLCLSENKQVVPGTFAIEVLIPDKEEMENWRSRLNPATPFLHRQTITNPSSGHSFLLHSSCVKWRLMHEVLSSTLVRDGVS